jgi:hypothetical protein
VQREAQQLAQQRAQQQQQQQQHTGAMVVNSLASWMALRLLRPRAQPSPSTPQTQTQQQQTCQVTQAIASHEG